MMKIPLLSIVASLVLVSCTPTYGSTGDWPEEPTEKPGTEEPKDTTGTGADTTKPADPPVGPDPITQKPRYIWIDSSANFPFYANSKENIIADLQKAKDALFTDIVVEVRPTFGDVLFKNSVVEQTNYLYAWVDGVYSKVEKTTDWDYLQVFIEEGHKLGLRVHAAMNTMVGGRLVKGNKLGLFYRDEQKAREWGCVLNTESGLKSTMDVATSSGVKFMNPAHPEVQEFLCNLLKDLAKYDLDGIFLDRARYDGLDSDFSETSRKAFEEYIGMEVSNFPDDILAPGTTKLPDSYPPYLTKWLEFRVKTIYDFMVKARAAVKSVNPKIRFGVYVGGWYSSYYDVGVNWADQSYDPHLTYKWATKDYMKYGYADLMDQMLIGAYANPSNVYGTNEWTMQGFCMLAKAKAGNGCPLISGGPDVGNWNVGDLTQAQVQDAVTKSVDACINACDGYFVFDICHLRLHPEYWDCLQKGIFTFLANQK